MSESEIKTKFSGRKEEEFYRLFDDESWAGFDEQEKLELLQELECRIAVSENRHPVKVVAESMGSIGSQGYYSSDSDVIHINRLLLQDKKIPGVSEGQRMASALDTVIHEGRHAFQHAVVRGEVDCAGVTDDIRQRWRINFLIYATCGTPVESIEEYHKKFSFYAFQPVERDAREFAGRKMAELYQKVKFVTGRTPFSLLEGMKKIAENKRAEYEMARTSLTLKDIEEKIDQDAALIEKRMDLDILGAAQVLRLIAAYGTDWKFQFIRKSMEDQVLDVKAIVDGTKGIGGFIDGLARLLDHPDKIDTEEFGEGLDAASIKIAEGWKMRPDRPVGFLGSTVWQVDMKESGSGMTGRESGYWK